MNVFQGGFLGLDNIGVFDRSKPLATGKFRGAIGRHELDGDVLPGHAGHGDGAGASEDPAYEDVASKFFEHFVYIASAMNDIGGEGIGLWDEKDGFYYDVLHLNDTSHMAMKVRSMVGLVPLFAVETFEPEDLDARAGIPAAHAMVSEAPGRCGAARGHEPEDGQTARGCC